MSWVDLDKLAKHNPATKKETEQVLEYLRRSAKARFCADENFPVLAVRILQRYGARVITAKEAGFNGRSDEDHAAYALKHGYVLLTCDRDYLDDRRFPLIQCPVIVVLNFGSGSAGEMLRAFRCLRNIFRVPQFYDKWAKLDAKRDEWTESTRFLNGTTSKSRYRVYRGKQQEWVTSARF